MTWLIMEEEMIWLFVGDSMAHCEQGVAQWGDYKVVAWLIVIDMECHKAFPGWKAKSLMEIEPNCVL